MTRVRSAGRAVAGLAITLGMMTAGLGAPVGAAAASLAPVSVSVKAPATAPIGSEVVIQATITRSDNGPLSGLRLALYVGGQFAETEHADATGAVAFRLRGARTEVAGTFVVETRFDGARGLATASASTKLTLRPATVTVTTVPAVAGISVSLGTQKASTGPNGVATFAVSRVGTYDLVPTLEVAAGGSVRVSFIRWGDNTYTVQRSISVKGDATFVLGLRIAYHASLAFVDLAGDPVDPSLIDHATFTSSTGGELVLTSFDGAWWEAAAAVSRTAGLQPSPTLWRLAEVEMAGTNVVNQGQQAFTPTIDGTWTVTLLLYDLTVRPQDALTGAALGGSVDLVFPDASRRTAVIGANGLARFSALPRGQYTVLLKTGGTAPPTPIALSRTQEAIIRGISYLDMGIAITLGLAVIVIFIWFRGRGRLAALIGSPAGPDGSGQGAAGAVSTGLRGGARAASAIGKVPGDLATIGGGRARAIAILLLAPFRAVRRAVGARPAPVATASNPVRPPDPGRPPAVLGPAIWAGPLEGDEDLPSHPCPHCATEVPDSARFCRRCGHLQPVTTMRETRSDDSA